MFCFFTSNIASFWWHNYGLTGVLLALIRLSQYVYYVHFKYTFPLLWNILNEITFKSHWVSLSPRVWKGIRLLKNSKLSLMNCEILKGLWHPLRLQVYCGSPQKEPREVSFLRKFLVRSLHCRMPLHLEISKSLNIRGSWKPQAIWLPENRRHTPPLILFK